VTLIAPDSALELTAEEQEKLKAAGVKCVDGPAEAVGVTGDCITVDTAKGLLTFDSVYPALGSDTHTQLGEMVGAKLAEDGCFLCDDHQRTSVEGLYAAGDVVHGLDQISHAMGEGGVAATTIRNDLAAKSPLLREPVMAGSELDEVEAES
jgi:thioredoxin reductase (NADPH)